MEQKTEQEYLEMLKEEYEGTKAWVLVQTMLRDTTPRKVWEAMESFF